jgi:hypothetical protein
MHKLVFTLLIVALLALGTAAAKPVIMPYKCDGSIATNEFSEGEDLCVYGLGLEAGQDVDLYVLDDKDEYTIGEDIAAQALHQETVQANGKGILSLKKVWTAIKDGFYDLVASVDGLLSEDDVVNAGDPALDSGNETDEGGQEDGDTDVPEFSTIMAITILALAGLFIAKKRKEARA